MAPVFVPGIEMSGSQPLVTFSYLRETNRRNLFECLESYDGKKAIVWDKELMKPFNLVAGFRELQQKDVAHMFPLLRGDLPSADVDHVLFLIRPKLDQIDLVAENVRSAARVDENKKKRNHLVFVPRTSIICETRLTELDLIDKFSSITQIPIHFYSTEPDFASLEAPHLLKKCLIQDDLSCLYEIVCAIDQLEEVFGRIPKVFYKGDWAHKVYDMLQKKREQDAISFGGQQRPKNDSVPLIDTLVMIDRWVDPMTPLITQLTYEGLIDEIFSIKVGSTKFPKDRFSTEGQQQGDQAGPSTSVSDTKQVQLNASDELFADLRDLNFNAVGPALSRRIKAISEKIESRHQASTVREYKEFVKRLPELQASRQSASVHTTIAELIKETTTSQSFLETVQCEQEILNMVDTERPLPYIEDAISQEKPILTVLRLVCLHSLTSDGLKSKVLELYCTRILQTYGYHCINIIINLKKAGLIRERTSNTTKSIALSYPALIRPGESASFAVLRKAFRLIVDEVNEQNPTDLSYVYSGYAPLMSRLCQYMFKPGWKNIMDTLKRVPGVTGIEEGTISGSSIRETELEAEKKNVLILLIGGITFAEISTIRYLAKKDENYHYLIASTHTLTGNSLLRQFCDDNVPVIMT